MGEGTKRIRIFTIIVLSLFMLTMIYFTASIIRGFKNGSLRAERDFMRISETASSAFFSHANSSALNELRNFLMDNEYVAAALVSSEKNIFFAYPTSSSLIGMNIEGKPAVQASSPMIRIFSTRLTSAPDENTMLTVALYTVRSADIYNPARISFLVILAGIGAIFIMLVYISKNASADRSLQKNSDMQNTVSEETEQTSLSGRFFSEQNRDTEKIFSGKNECDEKTSRSETDFEIKENQSSVSAPGFSDTDKDFDSDNTSERPEMSVSLIAHMENGEPNRYGDTEPVEDTEQTVDPSGLFSPATGVGWEQYLETRLDAELMRSASSEQDLALVLLRMPGIENNRLMMKKSAAVLLDFFKFKDFVFEYKNDGFAGVLLNINLDQTMVLAEKVYTQFKELLQSENIPPKIALGISTRSLRLLPGSKLIDEADKALHKAFDETGMPIVAFRVNPDKYRQFMADSARTVRHR